MLVINTPQARHDGFVVGMPVIVGGHFLPSLEILTAHVYHFVECAEAPDQGGRLAVR